MCANERGVSRFGRSTVERGLEASALGSSARPAGWVVGGHEGEDNVLRDDDLALFLTINALGIRGGADDPEPSAAVVAQAKIGRETVCEKCRNAKNIQLSKKVNSLLR